MKLLCHIIIVIAALAASAAQAEIYRIVDESGRVTFTDQPPADQSNASAVDLRVPNTQAPPERRADQHTSPDPGDNEGDFTGYRRFVITQPQHNDTITPGQTEITVQVAAEPPLQSGHLLQVFYDGQPVAPPAATNRVRITNLNRGTYPIQARILDEQGRTLAETSAIEVHIKRASILNRPGRQ